MLGSHFWELRHISWSWVGDRVCVGITDGLLARVVVTVSSSACTNEPSGEDLCTGCVAVIEKVLKSYGEILIG